VSVEANETTKGAAGQAPAARRPPELDASPVEWALWHAEVLAWAVFPLYGMREVDGELVCSCGGGCRTPGKHPITANGFEDATTDPERIRAWWAEYPDANIGSPYPSVLDCDLPRGSDPADGVAEYRKLERKHGIVAGASISRSGGGGLHIGFAPGAEGGKVGPGMSMRGAGLYAVLPNSRHASGDRYRYERPPLASRRLPPVPEWLRKKQTAARTKLKAKIFDTDERIPVNERHDAIAQYVGGLRRRNPALTEAEARTLAHAFRLERCEHPEDKVSDVDDLVAYVYAKEPPAGDAPWQGLLPALAFLLVRIEAFLRRFMIMGEHEFTVVVLFVPLTYVFRVFEIVCYLRVFSATKRCGKSRLEDILELLVHAPLASGGMSEAALFRSLAERPRTLLIDEIGKVLGEAQRDRHSDLARVLLNGFQVGKPVQRCVGEGTKQTVVDFDVYGPKVLAGTGRLDDQILDRCFPIELRRKLKTEPVERFRRRTAKTDAAELRAQLAAWSDTPGDALRDAHPDLPEELDDRGQDIAEPLLAIADLAGGEWPDRARAACVALRGGSDELEEDTRVELLADIKKVFGDKERLKTEDILEELTADPERPWATWSKGSPMSARELARQLRGFGIKPKQIWVAGTNARGYERADLEDAFSRYLSSAAPQPARPARHQHSSRKQTNSDTLDEGCPSGSGNGANAHEQTALAGLASTSPVQGEAHEPTTPSMLARRVSRASRTRRSISGSRSTARRERRRAARRAQPLPGAPGRYPRSPRRGRQARRTRPRVRAAPARAS
jgi:hypothetical protein